MPSRSTLPEMPVSQMIYTDGDLGHRDRQAADLVRALFNGYAPVTAFQVAEAMYRSEDQVAVFLRRAERLGLVRRAGLGWVPV